MLKKITIVTALSAAVLFGGTHQASAAANADQSHQQPHEVYYSINGFWKQFSWNMNQDKTNNHFWNWSNLNQKQEQKQESMKSEKEKPEQEQEQKQSEEAQNEPQVEQPQENKKEQQPAQPQAEEQLKEEATAPERQPEQNTQQQNEDQSQTSQLNAFEQEVVELTNKERANQGLAPLKVDEELSKVAREKSRDMSANNYFAHNSPTYGSPFDMIQSYGIDYRAAGENIAKGQRTPQEVVNGWMNSDGHRANILSEKFTHIGVGYVEQGNHWTQQFIGR